MTALADDGDDLFGSDDLFAPTSKVALSPKPKTKAPVEVPASAPKKDPAPSIFDDQGDDLFGTVKQKPSKKAGATPFLEDDNDEDLFGIGKGISKASATKDAGDSSTKQDIFQVRTIHCVYSAA